MEQKKLLLLFFCLCFYSVMISASEELNLVRPTRRLLPLPQKTETLSETYFFFDNFSLVTLGDIDDKGLEMFFKEFGPFSIGKDHQKKLIVATVDSLDAYPGLLELEQNVPADKEGYFLEVTNDKITIIGREKIGTYWGLKTLAQLIDDVNGTKVAVGARITDYPLLRYRGIQDDISRGPITKLEYLKKIVTTISALKMNVLSLYMELHVLEGVGKPGEVFTVAEFEELVEFAKDYHVEIIPSIQTFGHNLIFLQIPEYQKFANSPGSTSVQLDPTNPEIYEFLDEVIGRYAAVSPSQYMHINCDEVWELSQGKSGAWANEIGGISEVFLEHLLKVIAIVNKHGKTAMYWNDMPLNHKEIIPRLPKDSVVVNWHYMESASIPNRLKPFQEADLRQWGAPGLSNWQMFFPAYNHSFYNVKDYAYQLTRHNGEGILVTTWDDDGETLFGPNWFGVIISSEAAWRGGKTDFSSLKRRFGDVVLGSSGKEASSLIQLFADVTNYTSINYWKAPNSNFNADPFNDLDLYNISGRSQILIDAEKQAQALLEEIQPTKNQFMIETLPFVALKMGVLGRKLQMTQNVIQLVNEAAETNNKDLLLKAKNEIDTFIPLIDEVEKEFAKLWLIENKPYFLDTVKSRYDKFRSTLVQRSKVLEYFASSDIAVLDVYEMGFPKISQ